MKDVACGNFRKLAQNRHKPCDHEKRILWPLFYQFKNFWPRQRRGWTDPKKISDRFWYMERRNRSSYAKTRPVLRIGSELEDKTGTVRVKLVTAARIWWKRWGKHTNWTLTRPNQQQDLDQDTNSTRQTLKLKYAKAMARKVLVQEKNEYGPRLWDECKTLKTRG